MGLVRKLKRCPTTGWKSFFISHASISAPCVSARQILSGGCGKQAFKHQGARVLDCDASCVHPSKQLFEGVEPLAPEAGIEAHPIDKRSEAFAPDAVMGFAARAPVAPPARRA